MDKRHNLFLQGTGFQRHKYIKVYLTDKLKKEQGFEFNTIIMSDTIELDWMNKIAIALSSSSIIPSSTKLYFRRIEYNFVHSKLTRAEIKILLLKLKVTW